MKTRMLHIVDGKIFRDFEADKEFSDMMREDLKSAGLFQRGVATGEWSGYAKWQDSRVKPKYDEYKKLKAEGEEILDDIKRSI